MKLGQQSQNNEDILSQIAYPGLTEDTRDILPWSITAGDLDTSLLCPQLMVVSTNISWQLLNCDQVPGARSLLVKMCQNTMVISPSTCPTSRACNIQSSFTMEGVHVYSMYKYIPESEHMSNWKLGVNGSDKNFLHNGQGHVCGSWRAQGHNDWFVSEQQLPRHDAYAGNCLSC